MFFLASLFLSSNFIIHLEVDYNKFSESLNCLETDTWMMSRSSKCEVRWRRPRSAWSPVGASSSGLTLSTWIDSDWDLDWE